jgi:hypothetical protein
MNNVALNPPASRPDDAVGVDRCLYKELGDDLR